MLVTSEFRKCVYVCDCDTRAWLKPIQEHSGYSYTSDYFYCSFIKFFSCELIPWNRPILSYYLTKFTWVSLCQRLWCWRWYHICKVVSGRNVCSSFNYHVLSSWLYIKKVHVTLLLFYSIFKMSSCQKPEIQNELPKITKIKWIC